MKIYYLYIMTDWKKSMLYVGVTDDLNRKVYEHKNGLIPGPIAKYNLSKLVYLETTNFLESVLYRVNEIKNWHRDQKNELIESLNPSWDDLELLQRELTELEAA